jgi:hypothetical protein
MQLMELILWLKSNPWQSIRSMSETLGVSRRCVDKWLTEIHTEKKKGVCPASGRRCLVFAISLPKEKRKAAA